MSDDMDARIEQAEAALAMTVPGSPQFFAAQQTVWSLYSARNELAKLAYTRSLDVAPDTSGDVLRMSGTGAAVPLPTGLPRAYTGAED